MQEILNKESAHIVCDPVKKCLYQTWIGYISPEEFRHAIDLTVSCFQQYELESILSDTTDQAVLSKEGSDYAASVMPVLVANGLKKVAFVLSKSAFTRLSVQNFTKRAEPSLIAHFASREEAEAWLFSQT